MVEHPIGNVLWRNDGPGCGGWCWRDASAETRTGAVRNGMGLAVGDYDNDLDLDLYFSDMGQPMSLLQNVGGRFRNATEAAGVGGGGGNIVGWGTAFFDFDNDGWLDLFLAASGAHQLGDLERLKLVLDALPDESLMHLLEPVAGTSQRLSGGPDVEFAARQLRQAIPRI